MNGHKPKSCENMRKKDWALTMLLSLLAWTVILVVIAAVWGGCAPSHDPYMATKFDTFNEAVQAGLIDCRLDQSACEPTLELLATELAAWNVIIGDPNL